MVDWFICCLFIGRLFTICLFISFLHQLLGLVACSTDGCSLIHQVLFQLFKKFRCCTRRCPPQPAAPASASPHCAKFSAGDTGAYWSGSWHVSTT